MIQEMPLEGRDPGPDGASSEPGWARSSSQEQIHDERFVSLVIPILNSLGTGLEAGHTQ